jgi:excisionase family DNA binding protein
MSGAEKQLPQGARDEEVLTLQEAASFLRVSEEALSDLVARHAIPAQRIGDEWRFLKPALADWLRAGMFSYRDLRLVSRPCLMDFPLLEELMMLLEARLLKRLAASEQPAIKRGSKQALQKHLGLFRDEKDVEAVLADLRARREAGNAEGGE